MPVSAVVRVKDDRGTEQGPVRAAASQRVQRGRLCRAGPRIRREIPALTGPAAVQIQAARAAQRDQTDGRKRVQDVGKRFQKRTVRAGVRLRDGSVDDGVISSQDIRRQFFRLKRQRRRAPSTLRTLRRNPFSERGFPADDGNAHKIALPL